MPGACTFSLGPKVLQAVDSIDHSGIWEGWRQTGNEIHSDEQSRVSHSCTGLRGAHGHDAVDAQLCGLPAVFAATQPDRRLVRELGATWQTWLGHASTVLLQRASSWFFTPPLSPAYTMWHRHDLFSFRLTLKSFPDGHALGRFFRFDADKRNMLFDWKRPSAARVCSSGAWPS